VNRLWLVAALAAGCVGAPQRAGCLFDDECPAGTACFEGACTPGSHQDGGVTWCPLLEPKYAQINQRLLQVGCGAKTSYCHNTDAALNSNGLDLSSDPYPQLVGVPSENISQTAHLDGGSDVILRVKPGDPENSFLAIKLKLAVTHDARYGSGMPPDHPGGVCQSAQDAVAEWIRQGAPRN
jgi:hypothetical protein